MLDKMLPERIKYCTNEELDQLCEELRTIIYDTVMQCGGHLASNLGAVESVVALFHVFDFPKDKIVFDVGHQCYPYKLLSGRANAFSTLRQKGGISGFPKRKESVYDHYDTGHAGTSVSAGLGLAKARDILQENYDVIAYIGDGSFNNGLVYEALNSLKILDTKLLIILNDNGMSISPTVGGMHDIIVGAKGDARQESVRLLESFGLTYLGVKDGNDVHEMIDALQEAKELLKTSSVLLHMETKKGKGYEFSEEHPTDTHGIPPVAVGATKLTEYSQVLGETLCILAKEHSKIVVVSAAMKESLGLGEFFDIYPDRAFDVGICEENAVVLSASMAVGGLKPYYAVYSTFLQRSFDEIIHDVCAQDLPVTFCIDRAGIVGADGETHQGIFDLSYLSFIPNIAIAAPKDTVEFKKMLEFSVEYLHPLAIRYPRYGRVLFEGEGSPIALGKWEYLRKLDGKLVVIATGERCLLIAMQLLKEFQGLGVDFSVINARFIKPLDVELLSSLTCETVITIEDNVQIGGFGSMVSDALSTLQPNINVKNFAYKDEFIPQGNVAELQAEYGVNIEDVREYIKKILL